MLNMVVHNNRVSNKVKLDIPESPSREYTLFNMSASVCRCMCFPQYSAGLHMVYILDYVFERHSANNEFVADVLV